MGNSRRFVHSIETVEKGYHFLLIKKRNGPKDWTTKRILYERAQFLPRVQGRGRAQKRMLLSSVHSIRNKVADGLP